MIYNKGQAGTITLISLFLVSCTAMNQGVPAATGAAPEAVTSTQASAREEQSGPITFGAQEEEVPLQEIYKGSGSFINSGAARGPMDTEGEVTLNFQNSPIAEVVKTILGDILGANYAIDDKVTGAVSMRTSRPVSRDALIPTLENLLRMNGAALVKSQDFYEVILVDEASAIGLSPSTRLSADKGYQVLIAPLRYIGAKEMNKILEPVKSAKSKIIVDETRNMLTIAGTHGELYNLRETINIFDVNQLQGKSVGLFRMQNVQAATVMDELSTLFGDEAEGPLAGMVRFTVMDRLNALLVVTTQPKYLDDAERWIRRLDQAENAHGMNMYVYYVQNGKAENLADLLTQLFEGKRRSAMAAIQREASTPAPTPVSDEGEAGPRSNERVSSIDVGDVTIIADTESNSLLILATPTDYREVEKAIDKLDVVPLQVLVEASIVEVTLGDDLEYGLQWFFKDRHGKFRGTGGLNIENDANAPGIPQLTGALVDPADFTYAVFDAAGTRAILNAVAGDSRINVLSSPSLMVLDNQKATIRVGDQVPIRTSETSNTSSVVADPNFNNFGLNVTSQIQYRDTGVTLEVTPRVNAGGMVMLDITQRVDDVDETTTSNIDSPTILQREITTSVAVQSGETIVLGGLIRDNKEYSDAGIPFLKDIPGLGLLFGSKRVSNSKTELVVMITPTSVGSTEEARQVTDEYRSKLKGLNLTQ